MPLKRSSQATLHESVVAVPGRQLGLAEKQFVEDALSDVAPDWSVDLDGICDYEASLILLPEGGDDEIGPSFLIRRESFRFRLDQLHWDEMREVGTYPALADVISAVQGRLAFGAMVNCATSSAQH